MTTQFIDPANVASIRKDIVFSKGSDEFKTDASLLRTVAALNPKASRKEFVEACVAEGYRANSSQNRFNESRLFDRTNNGATFDADGRATNDY